MRDVLRAYTHGPGSRRRNRGLAGPARAGLRRRFCGLGSGPARRRPARSCCNCLYARHSSPVNAFITLTKERGTQLRTKIVATVGPATRARRQDSRARRARRRRRPHQLRARHARGARAKPSTGCGKRPHVTGKPIAVLADLAGPKIRIGDRCPNRSASPTERASCSRPRTNARATRSRPPTHGLARTCSRGNRILLDDGLLELQRRTGRRQARALPVVRGGLLKRAQGHEPARHPGQRARAHREGHR